MKPQQDKEGTAFQEQSCTTDLRTIERSQNEALHRKSSAICNRGSTRVQDKLSIDTGQPSASQQIFSMVQMNAGESNSDTADAFSNSLGDTALKISPLAMDMGGSSSSGSSRDSILSHTKPGRHSPGQKMKSTNANTALASGTGSSDDAGTGESANVVTGTGTSTRYGAMTSSGDDQTFSRGGGVTSSENSIERNQDAQFGDHRGTTNDEEHHHHRRHNHHHHNHHKHHHRQHRADDADRNTILMRGNDGSALKLPDDDGSDRISAGPATVVASRMPLSRRDGTSSSGSDGEGDGFDCLIERHREPGYNTIRWTFGRLPMRSGIGFSEAHRRGGAFISSSKDQGKKAYFKGKHGYPKPSVEQTERQEQRKNNEMRSKSKAANKRRCPRGAEPFSDDSDEGNGSSSGSGTEEGYMGSADSKENESSSLSVSSSDNTLVRRAKKKRRRSASEGGTRLLTSMKTQEHAEDSGDSSSSEIADFSSGTTSENGEGDGYPTDPFRSSSPSISSSNEDDEVFGTNYLEPKDRIRSHGFHQQHVLEAATRKRRAFIEETPDVLTSKAWPRPLLQGPKKPPAGQGQCRSPIMSLGSDVMAHCLTFLSPPDILGVLSMPLSKEWRESFTLQPELWRVLCLVEPFKAEIDDSDSVRDDDASSTESFCSIGGDQEKGHLDKYRLLYTSFVRCMKYLAQIREDAIGGRAPSYIDYGNSQGDQSGSKRTLQDFLSKAKLKIDGDLSSSDEGSSSEEPRQVIAGIVSIQSQRSKKKRKLIEKKAQSAKAPKIGISMITDRLFGPSASGQPGNLELPWSCAIYSIVNWMVSFSDVEGIQTLCMKVLPYILENEQQRQTAQRAGLTDIVLQAMVLFSDSVQLHTAAFHTLVLLARPLGGREGMLFHSAMILTGIFCGHHSTHPKSGIAIMVESMRRFEENEVLQAMSCWALVNVALAPAQKAELVKLGGIMATLNAMRRHPFSVEVQFRALFALINLVIPSVRLNRDNTNVTNVSGVQEIRDLPDSTERESIDESVADIVSLVVCAMKNFCSSEAILNRGCLVLHNLSLTQQYHRLMLWTPNCYQMLEWCLTNFRNDQVLQQSATGTLQRLQLTLSNDEDLRTRFSQHIQAQQQASLHEAHREALRLHQRHEELTNGSHQEAE